MKETRRNSTKSRSLPETRFDLLAAAVENCGEMIGMADTEGRMTFANRALLQTQGFSKDKVIGSHFAVLLARGNPPELLQEIGTKCLTDEGWRGECVGSRGDGSS